MDINLKIETLKQDLIQTLRESQLPISVIYYVMESIFREVDSEYSIALKEARQQLMQEAVQKNETAEELLEVNEEE